MDQDLFPQEVQNNLRSPTTEKMIAMVKWVGYPWRPRRKLGPLLAEEGCRRPGQRAGKAPCRGREQECGAGMRAKHRALGRGASHASVWLRAQEPCMGFEGVESYVHQSEGQFKPPYTRGPASIPSNTWPGLVLFLLSSPLFLPPYLHFNNSWMYNGVMT